MLYNLHEWFMVCYSPGGKIFAERVLLIIDHYCYHLKQSKSIINFQTIIWESQKYKYKKFPELKSIKFNSFFIIINDQ